MSGDRLSPEERFGIAHAIARLELEAAMHRRRHEREGRLGDLTLAVADEQAAATLRELAAVVDTPSRAGASAGPPEVDARGDAAPRASTDASAELERLREWHAASVPIVGALAVYGENANVAALVAKARALNEAPRFAVAPSSESTGEASGDGPDS